MDLHFKIRRAREEIERLDIEIPRVITNIRDERRYLLKKEAEVLVTNPVLAHQIALYRMERGCFDHQQIHKKLAALFGLFWFPKSQQVGRNPTNFHVGVHHHTFYTFISYNPLLMSCFDYNM